MRIIIVVALALFSSIAYAVNCSTISDQNSRKTCTAIETKSKATCYTINDPSARTQCLTLYAYTHEKDK